MQSNHVWKACSVMLALALCTAGLAGAGNQSSQGNHKWYKNRHNADETRVQLGPRPYFLIEDMDEDTTAQRALKEELQQCSEGPFYRTDFSIGHRGAPLQFPEHTEESYRAAARMGAGILECDVAFTSDTELVCRHSQCDLHTTTNILAIPELAEKCTEQFTPATFDAAGNRVTAASATCCTSDITLQEFKSLCGKMDGSNPSATTVEEYMAGTPDFRTDLYATCGTVLSHKESIALFQELGVKMTPELKTPSVEMPFNGTYTQEQYAQQMIDEYKEAGVLPRRVYPQSFLLDDVLYWIANTPLYGRQAVYLDGRAIDPEDSTGWSPSMSELAASGVNIIAPPIPMLLGVGEDDSIVPSAYAVAAKQAGLDIIAWSFDRSGFLNEGGGYYYSTVSDVINNDGDMMNALDVLAQDVGILGMFSDWPATVTYYANCKGL